jgi:Skp family chaperone for outer membrane proteins
MKGWKLSACLAALVVAGTLGAATTGNAQRGKAPAKETLVGFVDLQEVTEQIKLTSEWQVLVNKFEDESRKAENELEAMSRIRYLTQEERTELSGLRAKARPTDADKQRIEALERRSNELEREYQQLALVEKFSPEQDARRRELDQMRTEAVDVIQTERNQRVQRLQQMQAEVLEGMQEKILKIVSEVADKKNLAMVVDRQAVLYGGENLTSEVVKKLGK